MSDFVSSKELQESTDLAQFNEQIDNVSSASTAFEQQHRGALVSVWIKTILVGIPCWVIAWELFVWLMPVVVASSGDSHTLYILLLPTVVAALPFGIPLSFSQKIKSRMQRLFNQQVASMLGLVFSENAPLQSVVGHFFSIGNPSAIKNVFSGQYRGLPLRLFTYEFTTGSGKNTQYHSYTCCEVQFQGQVIELFVSSKKLQNTAFSWQPPNTHPLRTEGGLNDVFDVFIQDGNDIEGLQILEPNVILALEQKYSSFGFECCENRVTIFSKSELNSKEDFKKLMSLADSLYDLVIPEVASVVRTSPQIQPEQAVK